MGRNGLSRLSRLRGLLAGSTLVAVSSTTFLLGASTSASATTTARDVTAGVPAGISPGSVFEGEFAGMSSVQQSAVISTMKADGVRWLRVDTPGDFRNDTMIQMAEAAGINVDAVLEAWTTPLTPSAFSAFGRQAVAKLKPLGVETYEVLNEPNCDQYCLTADAYTQILQATYSAIKAADPSATVLTAGLGTGSGANEPYNYLTAMYQAGAHGYFDAMNMHPYSYPDTPLQTSDSWNPWSYLPELHQIMVDNGDGNKRIWLTEFGCPTGTDGGYPAACADSSLAAQIDDAFTAARSYSWTGPLFIYDWKDDATSGDGDFGLYYANGTPKPATLQAFEAQAANAGAGGTSSGGTSSGGTSSGGTSSGGTSSGGTSSGGTSSGGSTVQSTFSSITTPPVAPSNLRAAVMGSSVSLSWTNPPGSQGEYVYRDGSRITSTNGSNIFKDLDVPPGSHTYYVTAFNSSGEGGPSNSVSVGIPASTLSFRHSGVIELVGF